MSIVCSLNFVEPEKCLKCLFAEVNLILSLYGYQITNYFLFIFMHLL